MFNNTLTVTPYIINDSFLVVRDAPAPYDAAATGVLERHYNDVYKLLLAKLVTFDRASAVTEADSKTLKDLVAELIKVKSLLEAKAL